MSEKSERWVDRSDSQEAANNARYFPWAQAREQERQNREADTVTALTRMEVHNLMQLPKDRVDIPLDGEMTAEDIATVVKMLESCGTDCQVQDGMLMIHLHDLTDRAKLQRTLNSIGGNNGFSSDEVFDYSA